MNWRLKMLIKIVAGLKNASAAEMYGCVAISALPSIIAPQMTASFWWSWKGVSQSLLWTNKWSDPGPNCAIPKAFSKDYNLILINRYFDHRDHRCFRWTKEQNTKRHMTERHRGVMIAMGGWWYRTERLIMTLSFAELAQDVLDHARHTSYTMNMQ